MIKRYCVAERCIVEDRYYVEAESETEACKMIYDVSPRESEFIEVIETIVEVLDEQQ